MKDSILNKLNHLLDRHEEIAGLLADPGVTKLFHFARFDVAVLHRYLDIDVAPVKCTKIAAKLVRTFTDRHGLKDLCRELLGVDLSKQQQTSDWGAADLTADRQQASSGGMKKSSARGADWTAQGGEVDLWGLWPGTGVGQVTSQLCEGNEV